jgi:hypothetical protein
VKQAATGTKRVGECLTGVASAGERRKAAEGGKWEAGSGKPRAVTTSIEQQHRDADSVQRTEGGLGSSELVTAGPCGSQEPWCWCKSAEKMPWRRQEGQNEVVQLLICSATPERAGKLRKGISKRRACAAAAASRGAAAGAGRAG